MEVLKTDIDNMINTQCTQSTHCTHGTHSIFSSDVLSAIRNLKHDKKDGDSEIVSDHIIYSDENLSVHITILFTVMLRHGLTPYGMLTGTMIPIPKGRWANLSTSDNCTAIILCSILCKLLNVVILIKEKCSLCTSDLQYGFKQVSSTSLCTSMVQEAISYYVHNGSNFYGLMLDASKAFDRVTIVNCFEFCWIRKFVLYIIDYFLICT